MEEILREGEGFLEDIELAEANVQQAYVEYRDQVRPSLPSFLPSCPVCDVPCFVLFMPPPPMPH